jgi:hypothetical protein
MDMEPPRCALCGDVIGMYERYVLEAGDEVRYGSRITCPEPQPDAVVYHDSCHIGERA